MERRALYNSLRMHYLQDPDIDVQPWQVADYRRESTQSLIEQLASFNIHLDRQSFIAYAETCDSPEQLTEEFLTDIDVDPEEEDYIYLLIFELWRRLTPEKQTMSLFCDEMDARIFQFDNNELDSLELLEDILVNFQYLLDEQVDDGADPRALFESIKESCAHDIEGFLYDFISLQIENENFLYASEVIEGFHDYVDDPKWFALLKARLLVATDPEEAGDLIEHLLELTESDTDLDFKMEFLALLVQEGDKQTFIRVLNSIIPLLKTEEEFLELLDLCEDYFHCLDDDESEAQIQDILTRRGDLNPKSRFTADDPDVSQLRAIF